MIHVLFTVGLFMPYGGWISNEQTIAKKQVDKIKRNSSPKNETLLKIYSHLGNSRFR